MPGEMVKAEPIQIVMPDGSTAWVPPQYAAQVTQVMAGGGGGRGGGGMDIEQLADAGLGAYDAVTAGNIKHLARRARRARHKQAKMLDELRELQPSDVSGIQSKVAEIFDQQRKVDRAQTEALETGYKAMLVNALAVGGRVLGRATGGGGGGGMMGGGGQAALLGVGAFSIGALIFADRDRDWDDDDD